MTLPWCPLPRVLLTSPRARMLSLDAVGALFVAWSLADDTGTVPPSRDCTAVEALVFVATQHAREASDLDGEAHTRAADAVTELLDGGLVIVEGDALRLAGWVHLDGAPLTRPSAPLHPASDAPADGPRAPGRPRKAAPMTPKERQRRSRFDAREGKFRDVPAGVTWEQWRAENPVTETPARRHENPDAVTKTPAVGHENSGHGHENSVTKTPAVPRASGPEDQKDAENKGEGESGARPTRHENSVTKTPAVTETPEASFRDGVRCSTVESLAPFEADVVLDQMRKASAGRFSSAAVSTQMQAFGALARELIARGHATPESLVTAAGHAPHVGWIARLPGPLTVQRLCADEGRVLVELLTGAATCATCGGNPLASGVFEAPARESEATAFNAEIERKRAALRAVPMTPEALRLIEGANAG